MSYLLTAIRKVWSDMQSSPRLRWGLMIIVVVLLVEGGLRWSDAIALQRQQISGLQAKVANLRAGMKDEALLKDTLIATRNAAALVDSRLWTVSSEAVGQAKLKDWLTDVIKRNIADQYTINLSASREMARPETGAYGVLVATNEQASSDKVGVREFRANITFKLTPKALEGVLIDVEGGEPLSAVESLLVKGLERRVEMTVRVLMRIQPQEVSHG